jgi:hypothetical protein
MRIKRNCGSFLRRSPQQPKEVAERMDPISPELVLVDPELAQIARARLPDLAASNGRATRAQADAIAGVVPRAAVVGAGAVAPSAPATVRMPLVRLREAAVAELDAEAEARSAPGRKLLLAAAGLCVFLLGVFIPQVVTGGDPAPSVQPRPARQEQPAPASPPPAATPESTPRRTETQTGIGRAARATRPASQKRETKPSPRTARAARQASRPPTRRAERTRKSTPAPVPTRLFVWLPSREASYYNVRFFKGTRTIFEAWPTDARVTVPMRGTFRGRRFAFTNGRYRWVVRPAFGPRSSARYGEPIVRSVWAVRP